MSLEEINKIFVPIKKVKKIKEKPFDILKKFKKDCHHRSLFLFTIF